MKLTTSHLNLVQSVIKLMNLIVSKEYYYHWQSIGGSYYTALEKIIVSNLLLYCFITLFFLNKLIMGLDKYLGLCLRFIFTIK